MEFLFGNQSKLPSANFLFDSQTNRLIEGIGSDITKQLYGLIFVPGSGRRMRCQQVGFILTPKCDKQVHVQLPAKSGSQSIHPQRTAQ